MDINEIEFEIIKIEAKIAHSKIKRDLYYGQDREAFCQNLNINIQNLEEARISMKSLLKRVKKQQ